VKRALLGWSTETGEEAQTARRRRRQKRGRLRRTVKNTTGFGPALAAEKLKENGGSAVSGETLRLAAARQRA
jgi:hypothetical protein